MIWVFLIFIITNKIIYIEPFLNKEINYVFPLFGSLIKNKEYNFKILIPPENNQYGCQKLPNIVIDNADNIYYGWLIKKGNCSYNKKSVNVKNSGGFIGIVYLNKKYIIPKLTIGFNEKIKKNSMSPILLLTNKEGLKMKNILYNNKEVIINVNLNLENKKKIVKFNYGLNTSNKMSYKLLVDLSKDLFIFNNNIDYEPIYKFKNLLNIFNPDIEAYVKKNCIVNGLYCLDNNDNKSTIKEYYFEAIYQKCIYLKTYNNYKKQYWDYITFYYNNCFDKYINIKECRNNNFERFSKEINFKIIKCFEDSFVIPKNYISDNLLMHDDYQNYHYKNLYIVPSVYINDELFYDFYNKYNILNKICSLFKYKVGYCEKYINLKSNIKNKIDIFSRIIYNWEYLLLFILSIILLILLISLLSRIFINFKLKNKLEKEIDGIVSGYLTVNSKNISNKFDKEFNKKKSLKSKNLSKKESIKIVTETEINLKY